MKVGHFDAFDFREHCHNLLIKTEDSLPYNILITEMPLFPLLVEFRC